MQQQKKQTNERSTLGITRFKANPPGNRKTVRPSGGLLCIFLILQRKGFTMKKMNYTFSVPDNKRVRMIVGETIDPNDIAKRFGGRAVDAVTDAIRDAMQLLKNELEGMP